MKNDKQKKEKKKDKEKCDKSSKCKNILYLYYYNQSIKAVYILIRSIYKSNFYVKADYI